VTIAINATVTPPMTGITWATNEPTLATRLTTARVFVGAAGAE